MKNAFLILASLFITAITTLEASARTGETIAQCDQRYGQGNDVHSIAFIPTISGPDVLNRTYHYQGWTIQTTFINGRAALLRYSKEKSQKIQDDEVQAILNGEAGGGKWNKKSQFSLNPSTLFLNSITKPRLWTNSIGAEAYFENPAYNTFVVKAPTVEQYKKAKADAAEQQRKTNIPQF